MHLMYSSNIVFRPKYVLGNLLLKFKLLAMAAEKKASYLVATELSLLLASKLIVVCRLPIIIFILFFSFETSLHLIIAFEHVNLCLLGYAHLRHG